MKYFLIILGALLVLFLYHRFFSKHTLISNFSVPAWFRYVLEFLGKPWRQYVGSNDREEKPANRKQRRYLYRLGKGLSAHESFGSDEDWDAPNHFSTLHSRWTFRFKKTHRPKDYFPCAKIVGPQRNKPFFLDSGMNTSGISVGSQGGRPAMITNMGNWMAGAYQNTGEGGFTPYHMGGASVVWQIGPGNFGCRNADGTLNLDQLETTVKNNPQIRAIEIKESQGAKPGKEAHLPGHKVDEEIAEFRGIPVGEDCFSPPWHSSYSNNQELIDLCEEIAARTGLPVGVKMAVGHVEEWTPLFELMAKTGMGPDYFQIDGGEGGTGSAPPDLADHMGLPLEEAFAAVYKAFQNTGCKKQVVWMVSGGLYTAAKAIKMMALGADCIMVARPMMMGGLGCLHTQGCHNNNCPVGIQTNKFWLQMGLNAGYTATRVANFFKGYRTNMVKIAHSMGYEHPCQIKMSDIKKNVNGSPVKVSLKDIYGYEKTPVEFTSMDVLEELQKEISPTVLATKADLAAFAVRESRWNFLKRHFKKKLFKRWRKSRKK